MKIGIITQPFQKNYGGIIQNYALQQVLKAMGHEPLTFEHDTCYTRTRWLLRTIKHILTKRTFSSLPIYPYKGRIGQKTFIDFVLKHINSVPIHKFKPQTIAKYGCDAYIVGSDQVWRPAFNINGLEHMFLDFADENCLKVAYAASFGTSAWEYSETETNRCRQLLQRFNAVSVREDSGVELCRQHFGVSATHVPDPTLLLDRADYDCLCDNENKAKANVFVYALRMIDKAKTVATQIAEKENIGIKILLAGDGVESEDTIENWIASFRDASYVVTDSFHGMVFSIIYNKPFFVVVNESGGVERYTSLLHLLGLESRIVKEDAPPTHTEIDWDFVNKKRDDLKLVGQQFLRNALI